MLLFFTVPPSFSFPHFPFIFLSIPHSCFLSLISIFHSFFLSIFLLFLFLFFLSLVTFILYHPKVPLIKMCYLILLYLFSCSSLINEKKKNLWRVSKFSYHCLALLCLLFTSLFLCPDYKLFPPRPFLWGQFQHCQLANTITYELCVDHFKKVMSTSNIYFLLIMLWCKWANAILIGNDLMKV